MQHRNTDSRDGLERRLRRIEDDHRTLRLLLAEHKALEILSGSRSDDMSGIEQSIERTIRSMRRTEALITAIPEVGDVPF